MIEEVTENKQVGAEPSIIEANPEKQVQINTSAEAADQSKADDQSKKPSVQGAPNAMIPTTRRVNRELASIGVKINEQT